MIINLRNLSQDSMISLGESIRNGILCHFCLKNDQNNQDDSRRLRKWRIAWQKTDVRNGRPGKNLTACIVALETTFPEANQQSWVSAEQKLSSTICIMVHIEMENHTFINQSTTIAS